MLGSLRFEPYEVLFVPITNPKGYQDAFENCKKAMDESDLIICYVPDGIGEHTGIDLEYARTTDATVIVVSKEIAQKENNVQAQKEEK